MNVEKVIKGLEHFKKYGSLGGNDCNGHYEYTDNLQEIIKANNHRKDCPYGACKTGCVVTLICNTIDLLKEQEGVKPLFNKIVKHFVCPKCSLVLDEGRDNYCPSCGKKIEWTEYYIHEDD